MRFNNYIEDEFISYDLYCHALDNMESDTLEESIMDYMKDKKVQVVNKVKAIFTEVKNELDRISHEVGLEYHLLLIAFKDLHFYGIFKGFGYTFHRVLKAMTEITGLFRGGLLGVFKQIEQTGGFKKLKRGAIKIDDLLDQYPLLKRVGGIAVAGLLFYIWLNMTFIGDIEYDFNFSNITDALKGTYTLEEFFVSHQGLMLGTLFATGTLISAPWLGSTIYNLVLAVVYTGLSKLKGHGIDQKVLYAIRKRIKTA